MINFQKKGYSVAEVAQMLHCHPVTCRNKIYAGEIKADVEQRAKRTVIRIPRENLIDYMSRKSYLFDYETLKAFGIDKHKEAQEKRDAESPKKPLPIPTLVPKSKEEEPAKESFIPGTTTKPVGVWKDLLEREKGEKTVSLKEPVTISGTLVSDISEKGKKLFANNTTETKLEFKPFDEYYRGAREIRDKNGTNAYKEKQVTGMVAINGRIAIANVAPETAAIIFNAIKDDPVVDFDELKLVINRR